MKNGPGAFNKVASESYKNMDEALKAKLQDKSAKSGQPSVQRMSVEEAQKEGRRLFAKIRSLVSKN